MDQGLLNEDISQLYNSQKNSGNIDPSVKAEYDLYSKIMTLKQDRSATVSKYDQEKLGQLYETLINSLEKLNNSTENLTTTTDSASRVYAMKEIQLQID